MEKLIKDIVELDKEYRLKVDALRKEKDKIDAYIRDEKTKMEAEYKGQTEKALTDKKDKLDKEMDKRKREFEISYQESIAKMEAAFKAHFQEWTDQVYNACLKEE